MRETPVTPVVERFAGRQRLTATQRHMVEQTLDALEAERRQLKELLTLPVVDEAAAHQNGARKPKRRRR